MGLKLSFMIQFQHEKMVEVWETMKLPYTIHLNIPMVFVYQEANLHGCWEKLDWNSPTWECFRSLGKQEVEMQLTTTHFPTTKVCAKYQAINLYVYWEKWTEMKIKNLGKQEVEMPNIRKLPCTVAEKNVRDLVTQGARRGIVTPICRSAKKKLLFGKHLIIIWQQFLRMHYPWCPFEFSRRKFI